MELSDKKNGLLNALSGIFGKPIADEIYSYCLVKSEGVCSICMEDIPVGKRAPMQCFHPFCKDCLFEWYKLKNTCPECKIPFCYGCGMNPSIDILPSKTPASESSEMSSFQACVCPMRGENIRATTCNLCGEWAPDHDITRCPANDLMEPRDMFEDIMRFIMTGEMTENLLTATMSGEIRDEDIITANLVSNMMARLNR